MCSPSAASAATASTPGPPTRAFIVSHALLRDEAHAGPLRDWLGSFAPGALLILDEAHHAAPASGAKYAIDSILTKVVRDLARRFEHRLFLTATPHNGHSNSFAALLELLDPQRFCRGVPVKSARLLDDIMVRRLKADLRALEGGFPERHVVQLDIDGSFVTSANFTEAAQDRNVEAGVLVDDAHFAASLRAQFDGLVGSGELRRLPL